MAEGSDPGRGGLITRLSRLWRAGTEPNGAGEAEEEPASPQAAALQTAAKNFDSLRVEDVMVPRADIIAVEIETPLAELVSFVADAAHSRLPVFRETLDDPVGMVHLKDIVCKLVPLMRADAADGFGDTQLLNEIKRPLLYVPASMRARDLLVKMQSRRVHMALVVDEFGGTDGLVTLEDLVEEIVGDIADEHDDDDAPALRARGGACWEADARVSVEDFEAATQRPVSLPDLEEEIDTLGGVVFALAGRVPERGEVIEHPYGFEFEVAEADPRRIKRLVVRAKGPAEPIEDEPTGARAPGEPDAALGRDAQAA
ncbi:MAG: transporter associated domain-containing protein [Maricaulaceae bacterium]